LSRDANIISCTGRNARHSGTIGFRSIYAYCIYKITNSKSAIYELGQRCKGKHPNERI